jgi:hypothetical protein
MSGIVDLEDEPQTTPELSDADRAIIDLAKTRFKSSMDRWAEDRAAALDDIRFYGGQQWDGDIEKDRDDSDRPCLTVNMLPQFVFQVTNEQRQNKPSIRVRPFDSKADVKTAEKLQGLIRHIEQNSSADVAYDTAFNDAVISGLGFWRVRTDYCNEESFDQDIYIERIENRFSVYTGPAKKADFSDMRWCFVTDDIPREEFREQWPDAEVCEWGEAGEGDTDDPWWGENTVKVAEYWIVEEQPAELLLMEYNGVPPEQAAEGMQQLPPPPQQIKMFRDQLPEGQVPAGYRVVKTRKSHKRVVKWYKISGAGILERGEWAGRWIPIVPVLGIELHIEGNTRYYGLVRNAKDPQRMYNYWWTAETEMIALAPKAPWVAAEGQISGSADPGAWERSHVENIAALEYKPVTLGGQLAPPPQRQTFAGPPAGVVNARLSAREDMKAATGIYSAGLGDRGPEKSGIAIQRRQSESDVATFHYIDNLARAIKHTGRICVDLIRKVYDQARVGRVLGENGDEELVLFNSPYQDEESGETVMYDLTVGEYDVVVSMGPAYAAQRQEAADIQAQMVDRNPKLLDIGGDIILRNIDGPGMQELADRVERTIPPEILGKKPGEEKDGKATVPILTQQLAATRTQLEQMGQALDQLTQALNEEKDKTRTEQNKLDLEREKMYLDAQTKLEIATLQAAPSPEVTEQITQLTQQLEWMRTHVAEMELRQLEGAGPGGQATPPAPAPAIPEEGAPAEGLPPEPAPPAGNEPPATPEGMAPPAPAEEEIV